MWTALRARVSRLLFALKRRRLDDDTRLEIDAHLDLLTERYLHQGLSPDDAYTGRAAPVRQRAPDAAGHPRDEQHRLDRAGHAGSSVRVPAACAAAPASPAWPWPRSAWALVAPPPCSVSCRRSCSRRCRTRNPGSWCDSFNRIRTIPTTRDVVAGTHFTFLREQAASFEDVAALAHYSETGLDLVTDGRAERVRVLRVSSGYFNTLRSPLRAWPRFRPR